MIAVDAISYLADAALNYGLDVYEPRPTARSRNLMNEMREGLRFTYRHRTLNPLATSTHVWFLANGAALTVLSLFTLRSLGFSPYTYGLLLTTFGVVSLLGASSAHAIGTRIGSGRAVILARTL